MRAQPATAAPPPVAIQAMAPGLYLTLRRRASGLTLQHVVLSVVHSGTRDSEERRAAFRQALVALEADQLSGPPQIGIVDKLKEVFSFDAGIYWLLVSYRQGGGPNHRPPAICRGCGCTQNDACDDLGQGCAWVPGDPNLCTVCERNERTAAAAGRRNAPRELSDA